MLQLVDTVAAVPVTIPHSSPMELTAQNQVEERRPLMGLCAALERESDRILGDRATQEELKYSIICQHEVWQCSGPHLDLQLKLTFHRCEALAALSVVLHHSFRLNAFPRLKAQFWRGILDLKIVQFQVMPAGERERDAWCWAVEREDFPVICIHWSPICVRSSADMEIFFRFFTTPPAHGLSAEHACARLASSDGKLIPISLDTDFRFLISELLQRLEELLDRVFASPTRQYRLVELDLSRQHPLEVHHLECIADILSKNRSVYGIEHLQLKGITMGYRTMSAKTAGALQKVVAAAVGLAAPNSGPSSEIEPKTLNLDSNCLTLQHATAICASFRYGCPSFELSLRDIFPARLSKEDQIMYWRWIAFGMFTPRARRFGHGGSSVWRVNLSGTELDEDDVEAFIRTLRDPAGELAACGNTAEPWEVPAEGKARLCVVQQGATFYTTTNVNADHLLELEPSRQQYFEVLCQQRGWTCVVLPGVGCGWVQDQQVLSLEDDEVESEFRVELTFSGGSTGGALDALLGRIGRHLSYLDVPYPLATDRQPLFQAILEHCVNLKHLLLASNFFRDEALARLLDVLRGDRGDQLLSINLNGSRFNGSRFSDAAFQQLAAVLGDPAHVPALQELRIHCVRMTHAALSAIHHVLRVNKNLRVLKLRVPRSSPDGDDNSNYLAACLLQKRIREDHEGEKLPSSLELKSKVAFLSVVGELATRGCGSLDSFVVSTIFQFAADDVRRRIIWVAFRGE